MLKLVLLDQVKKTAQLLTSKNSGHGVIYFI